MSTDPAACAGVVKVMEVDDSAEGVAETPPITTALPLLLNPVPERVTLVPPAVDPLPGETFVIAGGVETDTTAL